MFGISIASLHFGAILLALVGSMLIAVISIKHPILIVFMLTFTIWLSPIYEPLLFGGFTLNRFLGFFAMGVIATNKILKMDRNDISFSFFDGTILIYLLSILISLFARDLNRLSINLLIDLLTGYAFFWITYNVIQKKSQLNMFTLVLILLTLILSITTIANAIEGAVTRTDRYEGIQQVNIAAQQMAATIPLLLILHATKYIPKIIVLGFLFLLVIGVLLTGSRAGILSLFIILIIFTYWSIKGKGGFIFTLLVIVGMGIAFYFVDQQFPQALERGTGGLFRIIESPKENVDIRYEMQRTSWRMFSSNPLAGIGFGKFQEKAQFYSDVLGARTSRDHNFYTITLAEVGLLGITSVICILGSVFSAIYRAYKSNFDVERKTYLVYVFTSFLVFCVFNPVTHGTKGIADKSWFVIAALCMITASLKTNDVQPKAENLRTRYSSKVMDKFTHEDLIS